MITTTTTTRAKKRATTTATTTTTKQPLLPEVMFEDVRRRVLGVELMKLRVLVEGTETEMEERAKEGDQEEVRRKERSRGWRICYLS